MERFGVKSAPSRNRSKTALYVTPQDRVTEFGSELHEDGGKLFCTSCNVVLNHVRKSAINDHLKSKTHTKRKALPALGLLEMLWIQTGAKHLLGAQESSLSMGTMT